MVDDSSDLKIFLSRLDELATKKIDDNFVYYTLHNPEEFLNWTVRNDFLLHGTTLKIKDNFEPRQGHDVKRESGRKVAIYMTDDVLAAMFMALVGGTGIDGHTSFGTFSRTREDGSKKTNHLFTTDKPQKIKDSGYVYLFARKQADEYIDGEYHAYSPQKPLASIRIRRIDFRYPIEIMSQQESHLASENLKSL